MTAIDHKRIAHNWLRSKAQKTAGAQSFEDFVAITDPNKAFESAVREADSYYGHQEGYSGAINMKHDFKIVQREPVSMHEAEKLKEKYNPDKWGPAFAIAIGDEKVVVDKDVVVKVKAHGLGDAQKAAEAKLRAKIKVRKGAKLEITPGYVREPVRPGGLPEVEKTKGTHDGFVITHGTQLSSAIRDIYKGKRDAAKKLKELLSKSRKDQIFTTWKVQQLEVIKVTGEPSKLSSWEIPCKVKQVQVGRLKGWMFFGYASS